MPSRSSEHPHWTTLGRSPDRHGKLWAAASVNEKSAFHHRCPYRLHRGRLVGGDLASGHSKTVGENGPAAPLEFRRFQGCPT